MTVPCIRFSKCTGGLRIAAALAAGVAAAGSMGCQDAFLREVVRIEGPTTCPDDPPQVSVVARSSGELEVSWSYSIETRFTVTRRAESETVFVDRNETTGTRYVETVRDAIFAYRVEPLGCPPSVPVEVRAAPAAPADFEASTRFDAGGAFIDLSWTVNNRLDDVCFRVVPGGDPAVLVDNPSFTDGPFGTEVNRTYTLQAVHPCQMPNLDSGPPLELPVKTPPPPPEDLQVVEIGPRKVRLSWQHPNVNQADFLIRRTEELGGDPVIETVLERGFTDTSTSLEPGVTYIYEVEAVGQDGNSQPATTGPFRLPREPVATLGPVTLNGGCRIRAEGTLELDPLATSVASTSGSTDLPSMGRPVAVLSSTAGVDVPIEDGLLDLDLLRADGRFVLRWTVVDDLGGAGTATFPGVLTVGPARAPVTPTRAPGAPADSGRGSESDLSAVPGVQPLKQGRGDACLDCAGRLSNLALGYQHACVLRDAPAPDETRVSCWGNNFAGEITPLIPNLTTYVNPVLACAATSTSPGQCVTIRDAVQVTTGTRNTCILRRSGEVYCAGLNEQGTLGRGTITNGDVFEPVCRALNGNGDCVPLDDVERLAGFSATICAFRGSGEILCWGGDFFPSLPTPLCGQVSIADPDCATADRLTSASVASIGMVAGALCTLSPDGVPRCAGFNRSGQLGRGVIDPGSLELGKVCASSSGPNCPALDGVVALDGGNEYMCALREGGEVWCWGSNRSGELGSGRPHDQATASANPLPVCTRPVGATEVCPAADRLQNVVAIAAGQTFACALLQNGTVRCWGDRSQVGLTVGNPLGDGLDASPIPRPYAERVCRSGSLRFGDTCDELGAEEIRPDPIIALSAGEVAACAVSAEGFTYCWGRFALGHGFGTPVSTNPVPVCLTGPGDGGGACAVQPLDDASRRICAPLTVAN